MKDGTAHVQMRRPKPAPATIALLDCPEPMDPTEELFRRLLAELEAALVPTNGSTSPLAVAERGWDAVRKFRGNPPNADRVDLLCLIAKSLYFGAQTQRALAPAVLAVEEARKLGDPLRLRRALTSLSALYCETGNQPAAIEAAAEGLKVGSSDDEPLARAKLLSNIGAALFYSGQYEDAIDCFEAALENLERTPANATTRIGTLANIALACLNLDDLRAGLRAARRAVEEPLDQGDITAIAARCDVESHYVRLLLETGNNEKARERCRIMRELVTNTNSGRDIFAIELAEGLTEVHDNKHDIGFSRLRRLLESTRKTDPVAVETILRVLVSAHEGAGQYDEALMHLKELMEVVRTQREQSALLHHQHHMERVLRDHGDEVSQERLLERKEKLLAGQLASRRYRELSTESLERLAVTAELRDDSTGEHSYRVGLLASLLARELGCEEDFSFNMDLAGRLHDIGKIGIPDHILLKPGRLTDVEFNMMKTHATVGAELLARSNLPQMQIAEEIARYHHERWDGKGYPVGLVGEAIPRAARITALADVFDALTHVRPYKHAWPVAESLEEIKRLSGTHFDPDMVPVFLALVHRLQREYGDLDGYLGQAARKSSFIQARKSIAATLRRRDDERTLDVRR